MAKCRHPGTYLATYDLPNQGSERKDGGNGHHQDQDAPISDVTYIQYLRVKGPDLRKWQTRRVPPNDEGLQDWHLWNGNYFRDWEKSIYTHNAMRGSPEVI